MGLWTRVAQVTCASCARASPSGVYPGAVVRPHASVPVPVCGVPEAKTVPAAGRAPYDDEPE